MIVKIGRKNNNFEMLDSIDVLVYREGTVRNSITNLVIHRNNTKECVGLDDVMVIYVCNNEGKTVEMFYPSLDCKDNTLITYLQTV